MSIDCFLIKTGVHILCCTWGSYVICIIIRNKVIKMQYSKLSFGGGSCLFSATYWGWVTNILCHYEGGGGGGRGYVFLRNWVFISPTSLYLLTSPLLRDIFGLWIYNLMQYEFIRFRENFTLSWIWESVSAVFLSIVTVLMNWLLL